MDGQALIDRSHRQLTQARGILALSDAMLNNMIHRHPNAEQAMARLAAELRKVPAHDMVRRDGVWVAEPARLGEIRCPECGDPLTAPRKYDLCPDCYDAMLASLPAPADDIYAADDTLPLRIAAAMEDADEREKRDRLIILPERGDVSGEDAAVRKVEEERADWDRTNDGDRFE